MQIVSWLNLMASLEMLSSRMGAAKTSTEGNRMLTPLINNHWGFVLSSNPNETLLPLSRWNNFDLKSPMGIQESKVVEKSMPDDKFLYVPVEQLNGANLKLFITFLEKLLQATGPRKGVFFFLREPDEHSENDSVSPQMENQHEVKKRQRFYRPYPGKRYPSKSPQNKNNYQLAKFVCKPSREDVYKLLAALHDGRQSFESRRIAFCHRNKLAGRIYTNLRFVGRRK